MRFPLCQECRCFVCLVEVSLGENNVTNPGSSSNESFSSQKKNLLLKGLLRGCKVWDHTPRKGVEQQHRSYITGVQRCPSEARLKAVENKDVHSPRKRPNHQLLTLNPPRQLGWKGGLRRVSMKTIPILIQPSGKMRPDKSFTLHRIVELKKRKKNFPQRGAGDIK